MGTLPAGTGSLVSGQATDADGVVWWHLEDGNWVRSDVVGAAGGCYSLPVIPAP